VPIHDCLIVMSGLSNLESRGAPFMTVSSS